MATPNLSTIDNPEPGQQPFKLWIAHCPHKGCTHPGVMAATEWEVVHRLGQHIIQAHVRPRWTRGQES